MSNRWGLLCFLSLSLCVQAYHTPARPDYRRVERESLSRRAILIATPLVIGFQLPRPKHVHADTREAIAKAASKIPGYGSPDLFFPAYFEGTWDCIRECTSISTPKGEEALTQLDQTFVQEAKEHVGERLEYQVSYVPYEGHIIASRGANEEARWKARYSDERMQRRISARWQPTNPNILTVELPTGVLREIKVTKRGFEEPQEGAYGCSEYCRIADAYPDAGLSSVPRLSAVRVLSKYKRQSPTSILGLELVQMYPTESLSLGEPEPLLILKNRLTLTKVA